MSSLRPPGPPPSAPPPPVPSSSRGINKVLPAAPHARPRPPPKASRSSSEQPQWPARPQSQEIKDAAVWPVKAPRASTSSVARPQVHDADAGIKPPRTSTSRPFGDLDLEDVPAARPRPSKSSTESKRASLSALSLNRFSLHRSKPPSEEPAPPVPPIPGVSHGSQRPLHPASTVKRAADGRPVQRNPERLDSGGDGAVTSPGSASRAPSVVRMPPHTLQKKRSFFRRVADKLTRSRSSLRDDAASQAASYEVPAASIGGALPPNARAALTQTEKTRGDKKSPDARRPLHPSEVVAPLPSPIAPTAPRVSIEHTPEPPTPTARTTRKSRPPDIQIKPPESSTAYPLRSPPGDQSAVVKPRASVEQPRSPSKPRASVEQPRSPKPRMSSEQPHSSSRGRSSGEHFRSTRTFTDKPRPPALPTSPTSLALPSSPTPLTLRSPRSPRSIPLPHSPTLPALAPTLAPSSPTTLPSPNTFPPPPPPPSPRRSRSRSRLVAPPSPSLSSAPPSPIDLPPVPVGPPPPLPSDYTDGERRAAVARVSSWLTQPPTPCTSLDHASVRSHAFERGADDIAEEADAADIWRAALRNADADDVLPEVERMALEAEERVRVRADLARAPTSTSKKDSNRRSLSLFRRSSKAAPPASARTQTLPGKRASRTSSEAFAPPASPRLLRPPVSPTMHTRGSILLETKDIEDPESRRLSELVFLT